MGKCVNYRKEIKSHGGKSASGISSLASSSLTAELFMLLDRSQFDKGNLALKSRAIIGILINTLTLYYGAGCV